MRTRTPLSVGSSPDWSHRFCVVTPVGPIAFDYGFNLLRRAELGEPVGAFHLSLSVF